MTEPIPYTEERFIQLQAEHDFQRTMLEDALINVEKKNLALQELNYELEEKKFELEQFIYRFNHDFKSPVSTIKGLIEVLELDQNSTNKVITKLKDTVLRLDSLIANMSYFYITTQLNVEKLSIIQVYHSAVAKFKSDIIKNKLEVIADFSPEIEQIMVVKPDFEAIFGAIISNAITFLDEKKQSHQLHIQSYILDDNLFLVFADNGIGVEKHIQEEIFKIFVRGSNQSKGAGLGLYILYKIVKKYKGLVGIESTVNVGMELKISIPLASLN